MLFSTRVDRSDCDADSDDRLRVRDRLSAVIGRRARYLRGGPDRFSRRFSGSRARHTDGHRNRTREFQTTTRDVKERENNRFGDTYLGDFVDFGAHRQNDGPALSVRFVLFFFLEPLAVYCHS